MNIEIIDVTVPEKTELIDNFNEYEERMGLVDYTCPPLESCWGWVKESGRIGAILFGTGGSYKTRVPEDGIVLPVLHAKISDTDYCGHLIKFFGIDWYVSSNEVDSIVCLFPYVGSIKKLVYPVNNVRAEEKVKEWFENIKRDYYEE